MNQLATTVDQLCFRLDSLDGVALSGKVSASSISKREFSALSRAVSSVETKVAALQRSVDRLSRGQSTAGTSSKNPSTAAPSQSSSPSNPVVSTTATTPNGPISVAAKAKVENRYVDGIVHVPRISSGPTGVVIIDVTVIRLGNVTAVSVNSGSTINDESIIDACKETALKTQFSYNPEAPDKTRGTITYTFKAKNSPTH